MEQIRETAFDWTSRDKRGYLTTNEKSLIQAMTEFACRRPEEVSIIKTPEINGGYLMAKVPKSWMHVRPPKKRSITDEQRRLLVERLEKNRIHST